LTASLTIILKAIAEGQLDAAIKIAIVTVLCAVILALGYLLLREML